jgi:hypothetical protein
MGAGRGRAYLELVLQQVLLVGQLAVEAEELGLVRRHFLHDTVRTGLSRALCITGARHARELPVTYAEVHLVLLVRVHGCGVRIVAMWTELVVWR